jgi:hypothetical protein
LESAKLSKKYGISTPIFEEIVESLSRYVCSPITPGKFSPPRLANNDEIHISEADENEDAPLRIFPKQQAIGSATSDKYGIECSLYLDGSRSDLTLIFDITIIENKKSEIHFCLLEVQ